MVNEIQYANINLILDRVLRHPLCLGLTLEAAILYTIDFIGIVGLPKFYIDKEDKIEIKDYRGQLPCDIVSIIMVKHNDSPLRSMTDTFLTKDSMVKSPCNSRLSALEETFKTLGSAIFTSFKEGVIDIAYRAIPVDCNGYPLLPDNSPFLLALEEYIKLEIFTDKFDTNKISQAVLNNQLLRYYWRVGQCNSEFTIPSYSEMQSITNMYNTLIPRQREFYKGFRTLGDAEYTRKH